MSVESIARASLIKHEGYRQHPYQCTAGKTTIAIGRNLEDRGISRPEAEYLLGNDIAECISDLQAFSYWDKLSDKQKAALIDMRFCLGAAGYRKFKRMETALLTGDMHQAALEVLNSMFAHQVGRRADDIAEMLCAES